MHENRICAHPTFTKYLLFRLWLEVQHEWRCEGSMERMTYRSMRECKGPRSIDHGASVPEGGRMTFPNGCPPVPSEVVARCPGHVSNRTKQTSDLGGRQMGPLFALTLEANNSVCGISMYVAR